MIVLTRMLLVIKDARRSVIDVENFFPNAKQSYIIMKIMRQTRTNNSHLAPLINI